MLCLADLQLVSEEGNTALIISVVVFLLVVVLLVLVVVVVVVASSTRKKDGKSRNMVKSCHGSEETITADGYHNGNETNVTSAEDHNKRVDHDQSTMSSRHYAVAYAFTNPASATAAFGADTYNINHYHEEDQVPSNMCGVRALEKSSVKLKNGRDGHYEEEPRVEKKEEDKEPDYILPDITRNEKEKEDMVKLEEEMVTVSLEHVYAQPDMAMKKEVKIQQNEQDAVSEESMIAPQPPLSYKKHREALQRREMERVVP